MSSLTSKNDGSIRNLVFIEAIKILLPEVKKVKAKGKGITYDSVVRDAAYIADIASKEMEKED